MIIAIKYAPDINYLLYKRGKSIEEVKKAFEHPSDKLLNLPMACIYDSEKKSFIEFDQRYRRYLSKFLELVTSFK
jgi:hypothetical protein